MDKYVYIIIKSKVEGRIRDKEDREEFKKILNNYPIIGEIIGFAYKIITKKPILTRMGKGKGKPVGSFIPIDPSGIILEGFISKNKIKYILFRMKKEGVFNSNSKIQVVFYESVD